MKPLLWLVSISVTAHLSSQPPYTIVGGVPAKEIRKRFSPDIIEQMQALKWWDWSVDKIREFLPYLKDGRWDKLQAV